MGKHVVMVLLLATSVVTGCKRDIKVTVCRDAKVLNSLSAGADIIGNVKLGDVLEADKPPTEPPNYWWLHTSNGKGMVGGASATRFPVKGDPYVVTAPSADVMVDGKPTRSHPKDTRLMLSFLPPCNLPEGFIAVVEEGRPVGLMALHSVVPATP